MSKAVFFDLDGVILNSHQLWYKAFNETLKQHKGTTVSFEEYEGKCKGKTIDDDIQTFFGNISPEELSLVKQTYKQEFLKLLPCSSLYPNVVKTLKEIKNRGYKTALITQTDNDLVTPIIEYFRIAEYFDVYVTGDMVKRRKPFPDPVLLGCKKLNVEPKDVIYIEDTPTGVESGKNAGVTVFAVTNTSTKEELSSADYIISKLDELLDFLSKL